MIHRGSVGGRPALPRGLVGRLEVLSTYGHLFPDAFVDVGTALDRIVHGAETRGS